MTTGKNDEPDLRTPEENASPLVNEGFSDPAGQFPRPPYVFEPSINKAARTRSRNELSLGGGVKGLSFGLPNAGESRYPYNQVKETLSGHVIEYDDTPGAERILIKHNSGSGVELRPDGSMVMKTEANQVTSVAGSSALIVEGDASMNFRGNLSLDVAGDLHLNVGGSIVTNVAGDNKSTVNGASRETVYGSKGSVVKGGRSQTTVGTVTNTSLGGLNEVVKGDARKTVQGNSTWGVSGSLKQTSEGQMAVSSPNMNIGASNLSIFGASGTIGGEGIVHYGVTYYGNSYYGDLIGTAEKAVLADETNSQNYPSGDVGTASGFTATDDGTATASATEDLMDAYLNQSANGTQKITVDEGDYIKNLIDRSTDTGGVSEREMTTTEVRSSLRDPANMSNSTFTGYSISSGKISPKYANRVPSGVNRVSSKSANTRLPSRVVNNHLDRIKRFTPSKNNTASTIVPEAQYDPNNLAESTKIDGNLQLGKGVKMSRFLGAAGDKVTLSHVETREEKLALARQYTLHANAISTVLNDDGEFKDHRLVVVEGLYKAGPGETITPESTNDYATKGQAVVYELHGEDGEIDFEKTYELAIWWKDSLKFDKLILSYDSFNPDESLTVQIILIMPEVDENYELANGVYKNEVVTLYNNNVQGNELIEILEA